MGVTDLYSALTGLNSTDKKIYDKLTGIIQNVDGKLNAPSSENGNINTSLVDIDIPEYLDDLSGIEYVVTSVFSQGPISSSIDNNLLTISVDTANLNGKGVVQLASSIISSDQSTAATPKAVYEFIDNAVLSELSSKVDKDDFSLNVLNVIDDNGVRGADPSIYKLSGIALGSENSANYSIVAGVENTLASTANYSLVVGTNNTISNSRCCVIGNNLQTNAANQTIFGKFNVKNSNAVLIIGNGTKSSDRKNALVIDLSSNMSLAGDILLSSGIISGISELSFDDNSTIDADKIEYWDNKEDHGFTSFKVWASTFKINSGAVSGLVSKQKNKLLEIYGEWVNDKSLYAQILTGMTEAFLLRTTQFDNTQSDVYVDWGDGVISSVANGDYLHQNESDIECDYLMSHTYSEDSTYIVKIFGKDYFGINHGLNSTNTNSIYSEPQNIVCEAVNSKFKIAKNVAYLASMFKGSKKLLKIDASYAEGLSNFNTCSNMFEACKNLYEVTNLNLPKGTSAYSTNMFNNCSNLHTISISAPLLIAKTGIKTLFQNCISLAIDINDIINQPFITKEIDMTGVFKNCSSLLTVDENNDPIIVPSKYLWEDSSITWVNTSNCFEGCPAEIRAQVPTSWGGTNAELEAKLQSGYWSNAKGGSSGTAQKKIIAFTRSNSENVSWDGDVATFTHNLNTVDLETLYIRKTDALSGISIYNSLVPYVIDKDTVQFEIPQTMNLSDGTWELTIIQGHVGSSGSSGIDSSVLEDYATKTYVDQISANFIDAERKIIAFTRSNSEGVSWNGDVVTFTHGLNTVDLETIYIRKTDAFGKIYIYNSLVPCLIDEDTIQFVIPQTMDLSKGTWELTIIQGHVGSSGVDSSVLADYATKTYVDQLSADLVNTGKTIIAFTRSNSTNVSWNDDVVTFNHGLNMTDFISIYIRKTDASGKIYIYNSLVPCLIDENNAQFVIPQTMNLSEGTWELIIFRSCAGTSGSSEYVTQDYVNNSLSSITEDIDNIKEAMANLENLLSSI